MTAFITRVVFSVVNHPAMARFVAPKYVYRLLLNIVVHVFLFAASYVLTLIMLEHLFVAGVEDLFLPGEVRGLFVRTVTLVVLVRLVVFWYHDLYKGYWVYFSFPDVVNIIRATVISSLIIALPGLFWEGVRIPQKVVVLDMLFCMTMVSGLRLIARNIHENFWLQSERNERQEILLAGPLKKVQVLATEMLSDSLAFYRPVGIIDTSGDKKNEHLRICDLPVFSKDGALARKNRFQRVRYVVVCWPFATRNELDHVFEDLKPLGIPFTTIPYFDEILSGKVDGHTTVDLRRKHKSDKSVQKTPADGEPKERIFLSPPHISGLEQEYVRRAFQSNFIAPLGPMVDAFEQEFSERMGIPHALALSSGTSAMHLSLKALDIGPGDQVIASTLTFIGSVTPIIFQGATPILIDSDRKSWNMDPNLLAEILKACADSGQLPKAVVPTDLYGQCSDYGAILRICEEYGVPVIVDAAEAMGATYRGRPAGTGATAAIYSFNGNKIITTSGGGMLASSDGGFVEQARFLSQQARDPVPHYEHSRIGYNYRMSNILAGIGLAQLKVLDERIRRKREIFDYYRAALSELPGIEFMPEASFGRSNRWLTVILITPVEFGADRESLRLALEKENIESRAVWKPMHLQPVFRTGLTDCKSRTEGRIVELPNNGYRMPTSPVGARVVGGEVAEDLFNRGLCLPSGTAMTEEDLDRVVSTIKKCHSEYHLKKRMIA